MFKLRLFLQSFLMSGILIGLLTLFSSKISKAQNGTSDTPDSTTIRQTLRQAFRFLNASNMGEADRLFDLSYKQASYVHYTYGVCISLIGKGIYARYTGQYSQAFDYYKRAEQVNSDFNNIEIAAIIENEKAQTYRLWGDNQNASKHLFKELSIRKAGKLPLFVTYSNISSLFQDLEDYEKALHYSKLAEKELGNNKNSISWGNLLIARGGLLYDKEPDDKENYTESINYTLEALDIARKLGVTTMESKALCNLSVYNMSKKKPDYHEALMYLQQALQIKNAPLQGRIMNILNLGVCYDGLGQKAEGEKYLSKAQMLAEETGTKEILVLVYRERAKILKKYGAYKESMAYYDLWMNAKDSMTSTEAKNQINNLHYKYETAQKDNELIRNKLKISRQQAIIQRKNTQTLSIISGVIVLAGFTGLYFRNRQKLQKQQIKLLSWQATLQGEEKERAHLAKELHDNIGGSLSTLKMWLGTIKKEENNLANNRDYDEALQLLDHTLNEVRHTAHNLMPELLLRHGLTEAVRIYCDNTQKAGKLQIEFQYFGFISDIDKSLALMIYRNIQELVQNIIKHADADHALVQLSRHDATLNVTIEDNGTGFDYQPGQIQGMGLHNIRTTLEHLKGHFSIRSEAGNGTTVYLEYPIDADRKK